MTNVHLVVMGVAGCGKSTVAEELARRLGWELAEGVYGVRSETPTPLSAALAGEFAGRSTKGFP